MFDRHLPARSMVLAADRRILDGVKRPAVRASMSGKL